MQSERVLRSKAEAATRDSQLEIEKLRLQIQNMMHTPSAEFEALVCYKPSGAARVCVCETQVFWLLVFPRLLLLLLLFFVQY